MIVLTVELPTLCGNGFYYNMDGGKREFIKVSLPNLEVLIIFELENLETLGHGLLSMGALSKLRDFLVRDCSKLLCVFPSQLVPMLQDFETLCVESCNLLEEVFESEGVDSNEPDPEILYSALKLVQLRNLPRLNYISKRDPMVFKYIQTLEIDGCDSLRYVFAPTVTKSIPQLRELKIWSCKMLSRIVAEENGMGESCVDEVEFPQLESLELRYLPNLRRFCNSTHPLELPRLSKMHIWFCRGMNAFSLGQVSAPNLSLPGILWNGDLNSAIQHLQKGRKKEEDEEEERRKWWEGVEERRKRDEEQRKTEEEKEERRKREEEERKWEEEWRME
ncbi:hypothetical protein Vadar_017535 [Vaccinium darrowii]|uniref:Uncharacterized protein n=1 Tax=Vaccinium darrowii TaxID=229202 RepID=A0ACB7YNP7_9ERIC|nr:hypothetical protein Vadar_017535 [Vaccinium darrowii]